MKKYKRSKSSIFHLLFMGIIFVPSGLLELSINNYLEALSFFFCATIGLVVYFIGKKQPYIVLSDNDITLNLIFYNKSVSLKNARINKETEKEIEILYKESDKDKKLKIRLFRLDNKDKQRFKNDLHDSLASFQNN